MSNPMRRESPYPMLPIAEAAALVAAHCRPLPAERVAAFSAEGRVLAETITAPENLPDLPKSAMDGYALIAADGSAPRRVIAEVTAGQAAGLVVTPGTAARVMTGAPLPAGADAMIQVELTEERDGMLIVAQPVAPGNNVQRVGQDVALGEVVLEAGSVLGAAEIGLLATLGRSEILVYRRPRVAVLATGDEVVEPDAPRQPGAVRDSNRYALMAAIRAAGGEALSLGIARDDEATQRAAVRRGLAEADVFVSSGGVSMGTRDLIKPLLAELGTVHFGRVAFKPGKPTTFATIGDKLAFGLPGNPASSLVSFEVFVRPALRRLMGDANPERRRMRVLLSAPIRPSPDRPEYQRVRLGSDGARFVAASTGDQGSSRLLSLRAAEALLIVPPGSAVYPAGSELEALLLF